MSRHLSGAMLDRIASYAKALSAFFVWLRHLVSSPASYHPGAHYMRGPGPKWREKHGADAVE